MSPMDEEKDFPDRPLECTECKKKVSVIYKDMAGENVMATSMCETCPVLYTKLHKRKDQALSQQEQQVAGLCCGSCGTTLQRVQMGNTLGCIDCYDVFQYQIFEELIKAGRLSHKLTESGQVGPLHMGKTPGSISPINPSLRLAALNEALSETIVSEDYEQAAWIRDQIRKLMESNPDDKAE